MNVTFIQQNIFWCSFSATLGGKCQGDLFVRGSLRLKLSGEMKCSLTEKQSRGKLRYLRSAVDPWEWETDPGHRFIQEFKYCLCIESHVPI